MANAPSVEAVSGEVKRRPRRSTRRSRRIIMQSLMLLFVLLLGLCSVFVFYLYQNVYLNMPEVREARRVLMAPNEIHLEPLAIPVMLEGKIQRYFVFEFELITVSLEAQEKLTPYVGVLRDALFSSLFEHMSVINTDQPINTYTINSLLDTALKKVAGPDMGIIILRGIYERPFALF